MTVFSDLETILTGLGYKVFAGQRLESVKTCITYKSVSQKIIGSMSGDAHMRIERVQLSFYALKANALQTMIKTVEDALAYYSTSTLTIIPTESKVDSYDEATSSFASYRDFYLIY